MGTLAFGDIFGEYVSGIDDGLYVVFEFDLVIGFVGMVPELLCDVPIERSDASVGSGYPI